MLGKIELLFITFTDDKENVPSDKARLKGILSMNLTLVPEAWIYFKEVSTAIKVGPDKRLQKEKENPCTLQRNQRHKPRAGNTAPT